MTYKDLFYKSQAEISDVIEELERLKAELIGFMNYCEDIVVENDLDDESKT